MTVAIFNVLEVLLLLASVISYKIPFYSYESATLCVANCRNGVCAKGDLANDTNPTWNCNCMNGYFGKDCSEHPCDKNPCKNAGECLPDDVDGRYTKASLFGMAYLHALIYQLTASTYRNNIVLGYKCLCPPGYPGEHCEVRSVCKDNHVGSTDDVDVVTCSGVGKCQEFNGVATCQCNEDHEGPRCRKYSPCSPSPCHNGFMCLPLYGTVSKFTQYFTCACQGNKPLCDDYDIDECTNGVASQTNAKCKNVVGAFKYVCKQGYERNGENCTDIDECATGAHRCNSAVQCINTVGSYICGCKYGYVGDGDMCEDINECEQNGHDCHQSAVCVNTPGSFNCECRVGFKGDGRTCGNVNECARDAFPCSVNAACEDTDGSFHCVCNDGFSGNGKHCVDVDECSSVDICSAHATCINEEGSYTCKCDRGYIADGEDCIEINECDQTHLNYCDKNAHCSNTDGSYLCKCKQGFHGDGLNCTDVDECRANKCHVNAQCTNSEGSYACSCQDGYYGDGVNCTDVNECMDSPCDVSASCNNTVGSFSCQCNHGYTGNGSVCQDTNECKEGVIKCPENSECVNKEGGYKCMCQPGYEKNTTSQICFDIDECRLELDECYEKAVCMNTVGSYTCKCQKGLKMADDDTCVDIDECSNNSACDVHAKCTNFYTGYSCECKVGYIGNGFECFDKNECIDSKPRCSIHANCTNQIGSFNCTCKDGFLGDGFKCEDIDECLDESTCGSSYQCVNMLGSHLCAPGENMAFAFYFVKKTSPRDVPYITGLSNPRTSGLTVCLWFQLSQLPAPHPRSLFQYMTEDITEAFNVWLHASPTHKLNVRIGGSPAIDVPFKLELEVWTHLCLNWHNDKLTVWRNGFLHNPEESYTTALIKYGGFFPASRSSTMVLGQYATGSHVPTSIEDSKNAYQGWVTHLMFWSRNLSYKEIKFAAQKLPPLDHVVVAWNEWRYSQFRNSVRLLNFEQNVIYPSLL